MHLISYIFLFPYLFYCSVFFICVQSNNCLIYKYLTFYPGILEETSVTTMNYNSFNKQQFNSVSLNCILWISFSISVCINNNLNLSFFLPSCHSIPISPIQSSLPSSRFSLCMGLRTGSSLEFDTERWMEWTTDEASAWKQQSEQFGGEHKQGAHLE